MSNVIRFLESMGSRSMTPSEFELGVEGLEDAPAVKRALLRRDESALGRLLGARPVVCCMILADEVPVH